MSSLQNQTLGFHSIMFVDDINNLGDSNDPFNNTTNLTMYRHTYDDWHMVPTKRPSIAPPSIKTHYGELLGADGDQDMTEGLSGRPLFGMRIGEITFKVLTGYKDWAVLYTELLMYFHGQQRDMILEDDPAYFYRGRFSMSDYDSLKDNSEITLSYTLYPYKRDINTYLRNWLWDPFDFTRDTRNVETISEEFTLQAGSAFDRRVINLPVSAAAYLYHISVYEKKPADATYPVSITRLGYTDRLGVSRVVNLYPNETGFTEYSKDLTLDTNSFTIQCTRGKVYVRLYYNLGIL